MTPSADTIAASAQTILDSLSSLSGIGSQLAGHLATEEGRARFLHESQRGAVRNYPEEPLTADF